MHHRVLLPQVELNMESVTVLRWLVAEGDRVTVEAPLLEVETQKATVEVPSPRAGFVRRLCVSEGQEIGESALLCTVSDEADEPIAGGQELVGVGADAAAEQSQNLAADAGGASAVVEQGKVRATPLARRVAAEHGVDLTRVTSRGPAGRIRKAEVLDYVQQMGDSTVGANASAPVACVGATAPCSAGTSEGVWSPLSPTRVALIAQMHKALLEIPQINVARQLDVTPLLVKTPGITFTHRLIRTVALAMEQHPALRTVINADRTKRGPVEIAVAMDTATGLVAPVIRHAQRYTVEGIAELVKDFSARAAQGLLKRQELTDCPFAISNLGMLGVDWFTPFVFHGQTAVLAVSRAVEAAAGRRVAWFTLAVDHRVVDGAEAARFLQTLQDKINAS